MGKSASTQPVITDPNDPNYDPALDPGFMDKVSDGEAAQLPAKVPGENSLSGIAARHVGLDWPRGDDGLPQRDDDGAEVVVDAPYGYRPSGQPKTEEDFLAGLNPTCPAVSLQDGPFDTTTIYAGTNEPLSAECADFYNAKRTEAGYPE